MVSGRDFLQMHSIVDRIEEKLKAEAPQLEEAKWTISKYGAFVWETQEKNPYLAISKVAYNFNDVQTAHKERKDHRPIL